MQMTESNDASAKNVGSMWFFTDELFNGEWKTFQAILF